MPTYYSGARTIRQTCYKQVGTVDQLYCLHWTDIICGGYYILFYFILNHIVVCLTLLKLSMALRFHYEPVVIFRLY